MKLSENAIDKRFGNRSILNAVSVSVGSGEIGTILGLSGCGKTTLLRIIAGLEKPDAGEVFLDTECLNAQSPQQRNIGFVFQNSGVYDHLTVERNLQLPLAAKGIRGDGNHQRVVELARRFGLVEYLNRSAGSLSGGEAQRLSLAKALIRKPRLMLLDEPFSHLDATLQRDARVFVLEELRKEGITTLLVTHDHQEAQQAGGPTFFLDEGRIVQSGSWESFFRTPASPRIAQVVSFLEPLRLDGVLKSIDGRSIFCSHQPGLELEVKPDLLIELRGNDHQCSLYLRTELLRAEPATMCDPPAGSLQGTVTESFVFADAFYCTLDCIRGLRIQARFAENRRPDNGTFLDRKSVV